MDGEKEKPNFSGNQDRLRESLSAPWEVLETEDYEVAKSENERLNELLTWRKSRSLSSACRFYDLFENLSRVNEFSGESDVSDLRSDLLDRLTARASSMSPRVADLYLAIVSEIAGEKYEPNFDITNEKLQSLIDEGDLETLMKPDVPYSLKINRIESRIAGEVAGRKALDRRDGQEIIEPSENDTPPPAQDESKPSMDEMEKQKEGESVSAIWTISPAYGGYYKQQSFDTWDQRRNTWIQSEYQYDEPLFEPPRVGMNDEPDPEPRGIKAKLSDGVWVRIPVPYTHQIVENNRDYQDLEFRFDQNGDCCVRSRHPEPTNVYILLQEIYEGRTPTGDPKNPDFGQLNVSKETEEKVREIFINKKDNLSRARALVAFIARKLKYSNDSKFNSIYDQHPSGYIAAIDENCQADCDVANTYFAALCRALNIPVRHVVGHMVKGKSKENESFITSGTGHAWSEVWNDINSKWVRVDATPPGEQNMEESDEQGESPSGDYSCEEAIEPTDEELENLKKKLDELEEKLSYTPDERELAEKAGVELSEARKIVKEIAVAEKTKLKNGELVVDVLSNLFNLIIESRKTTAIEYRGPLRRSEGGEDIDDVVAHRLGILAKDFDPRSRVKEAEKNKETQLYGGFDVYIIGDKSGSMLETVSGEEKWKIQRRAEYLLFSALHRFEQSARRSRAKSKSSLSVRTEGISFTNSDSLDLDKPLSPSFEPADKVKLWRSLGEQGAGNGDIAALEQIYHQITAERAEIEEKGKTDDRLRIILACSDGGYIGAEKIRQLVVALGELNAVVVGVGMGSAAKNVEVVYDTPVSRGVLVEDINDLPAKVAKEIVIEATKLFPEKSLTSVRKMISAITSKF